MAKKGSENQGDVTLGTDAWNVADGYSKIKILRHLIQLDRYDTIAQFGTEDVDQDFGFDQNYLNKKKCEAIERFISTLRQLLGNCLFALRKDDIPKINKSLERIKQLKEYLPQLYNVQQDQVSKEEIFDINQNLFDTMLFILQEVKDEINTALNKAGLIFRPTEEMDLDKLMHEIIEGG